MHKLKKYEASFNKVYGRYQRSALKRGLDFALDPKDFRRIAENLCVYCGAEPTPARHHDRLNGSWKFNGLDRVDNTKGYTIDNVQPCCITCNKLKSDLEETEFLNHIARIVVHLGVKSIKED